MSDYLIHYGVKGMKWGVRRYQNYDGTSIKSGKSRNENGNRVLTDDKKKIAKKVAITAAAVVGVYAAHKLINDPRVIDIGKNAIESMLTKSDIAVSVIGNSTEGKIVKAVAPKIGKGLNTFGKQFVDDIPKAGNAMVNAVMASVGAIGISRLADRLKTDDNASQMKKDAHVIALNTASAGIRTLTNANINLDSKKTNESSNKSDADRSVVSNYLYSSRSSIIGKPSGNGKVDKSSKEYSELFVNQDPGTRANIKKLANEGYSIQQIKIFIDQVDSTEIAHSMFETFVPAYIGAYPVDLLF